MLRNERKAAALKVNKTMSQNEHVIESTSVTNASMAYIKNVSCISRCIIFMPFFFFYVPYTNMSNF